MAKMTCQVFSPMSAGNVCQLYYGDKGGHYVRLGYRQ